MNSASSIPINLLNINDIRKKIFEQNSNMSQDQADDYAKAVFVRLADKTKKPELKSFFEKHPELESYNFDKTGEFRGFETTLLMPFEIDEISESDIEEKSKTKISAKEFVVKGTAIYPTLSKNFNRYTKTEIQKAFPSLKGKPIQKDHSESSADSIGTITHTEISSTGRVTYKGRVKRNHPVSENIELGYVKTSSIGVSSRIAECSVCGEKMGWFHEHIPGMEYETEKGKNVVAELIPKDFEFKHIGMVTAPAVPGASVSTGESIIEGIDYGFIESFSALFSPYYNEVVESISIKRGDSILNDEEIKNMKAEIEKQKVIAEEYKAELDQQRTSNSELAEYVNGQKAKERSSLLEEIFEAEVRLQRQEKSNKKLRIAELNEMSQDQLDTRNELLQDSVKGLDVGGTKKPRARTYQGEENLNVDEENPNQHLQEDLSGRARREYQIALMGSTIFGESFQPTYKTVRVLDEYDPRGDGKWKNPFKELI